MKSINWIFVLFLFVLNQGCKQSNFFEGTLTSKVKFEIKDSTERAIIFSNLNPSQAVERFKEGNSFIIYNNGDTYTHLYLQSENSVYENRWSGDTLYKFDCTKKGRKILSYTVEKNADTLLGIACSKLKIVFEGGSSTYFYNEKVLKINPYGIAT